MPSKRTMVIGVVIIALIAWGALTWFILKNPPSITPLSNIVVTNTTSATSTTTITTNTNAGVKSQLTQVNPPTAFTSPAKQAQWVLGKSNTIQWNRAANIAGNVYLVNAASGATIGWILQQSGPTQVFYPWDTSDVFLSKTSPVKKDITAGTYVIKIAFNSPEDPTITSQPFSIIYPSQVQSTTLSVGITNGIFVPSSLTIQPGNTVVFTNHDAIAYQVLISSFGSFAISAYNTYTFNTASLATNTYTLYSTTYPELRMSLVVK